MEKKWDGIMLKQGLKVLLVSDFHVNVFCWRKEIIDAIVGAGGEVALAVPYGEKLEYFRDKGCKLYDVYMDRHSLGIVGNFRLLLRYKEILKEYKPDAVLLYGSKGMLYAGLFCRIMKIDYYPNINGLGTIETMPKLLRAFMYMLYKLVVPYAKTVFFQNAYNMNKLIDMKLTGNNNVLLPGSGVNLENFSVMKYPDGSQIHFLYCARVMREKGIYEFIEAARNVKKQNEKCQFDVIGMCDDDEAEKLMNDNKDIVNYYGFQNDIHSFLKKANCVVLPSFYGEGISNSLLESAASGKPIITTDMPGCRETVSDGVSGYIIKPRDADDLTEKMLLFCSLSKDEQEKMGQMGRRHVELNFNRNIVVKMYMKELEKIG